METMEKHVENMKLQEEKHKKRACESETLIKDQLSRIKTQFDNAFIDFEKKILQEVRTKCTSLRNSISSQQSRIDSFEADLKRSKEKIISVEQNGQDLHAFLMKREMEKEMKQNEQTLQRLHQSSNRVEVSMSGKESASKNLTRFLLKNLSVTENFTSGLPNFPDFRHNRNEYPTSARHGRAKRKSMFDLLKRKY
jgi:hypothetical protein